MGYDFIQGYSKRDVIKHITKSSNWTTESGINIDRTCLAKCVRGSILWTVEFDVRTTPAGDATNETWIGCYILANSKGFGWGYKAMSESVGPVYETCPLAYLDYAPVANQSWRDRVVAYHARTKKTLNIGDRVALVGSTLAWVKITSVRPLRGVGNDGRLYRIPRNMLGDILEIA